MSLPDVGTHFVLTAVLVEEDAAATMRAAVDAVRAKHFQTGELRSKKLAKNPERFRRVLEDLKGIPFKFYAIVVDKQYPSARCLVDPQRRRRPHLGTDRT